MRKRPFEAVLWLKEFGYGYSVGKGIEIPDDFDGFEPVDPGRWKSSLTIWRT